MQIRHSMPPEQQKAMLVLEEELEMQALDTGIARYRAERLRNDPSNGSPEQQLIARCLSTLTAAIEKLQDDISAGKPAKGVTHWGYQLLSLSADKLAFLTLAEMVNHADSGEQASTSTIALAIGTRAKIEREFDLIRKQARDVYAYLMKRNKTWSRRAHRTAKSKAGGLDVDWSAKTKAWLGMTLLEHAVSFTDVFILERQHAAGKSRIIIRLKPDARLTIEKSHGECELLRPSFLPMVVPPCDWGDTKNGGYIWHRQPLVKRNRLSKPGDTPDTDMPLVLHAVNLLQKTEWRINQRVLSVLQSVWEGGGGTAGLPSPDPLPIPRPAFDWASASAEQKAEWKLQATRIHDENAKLVSQRKCILKQLWIAQRLRTREAIYFPYQLDWRGRAYPVPGNLHPQTDDCGRALLEFASGQRLGASGLRWLRIHLANCYGVDKVPFAEREQWTVQNLSHIRQSADNPLDYRWWAEGENPWQTLAACCEVAAASSESSSHLPVQMDGSCNGLQHFSAMGLDVVGGTAVNLVPSDQPSDVYQQVADRVAALVEEDICRGRQDAQRIETGSMLPDTLMSLNDTSTGLKEEEPSRPPKDSSVLSQALAWQGQVNRKVVKRATMTIVYGLTRQGMKQQFIDDGHCDSLDGNLNQNARYLTDQTWKALGGVLTGASAIMDWLRTVARVAAETNVAIQWTSPAGFPVKQEYVEQRVRHLYTAMQKLTLREPDEDGKISLSRQVRGLPPNFVHSFDAAHMMLTVAAAGEVGMEDFSMIHDSYGTHAAQIDILHRLLREQFIQMYQTPLLAQLHKQWSNDIGVELPPPPEQGLLDLTQVLESDYFFA